LKSALIKHEDAYYEGLRAHFEKHLNLLQDKMNLDELRLLYDFTGRTVLITVGQVCWVPGLPWLLGCHANVVILNRDQEKQEEHLMVSKEYKRTRTFHHWGCA
jgi:hypothetical protein